VWCVSFVSPQGPPRSVADAKAARATAMTSGAVHDYRKKLQVR
jgi:hypothetical protein